jgi:hypothetical protein
MRCMLMKCTPIRCMNREIFDFKHLSPLARASERGHRRWPFNSSYCKLAAAFDRLSVSCKALASPSLFHRFSFSKHFIVRHSYSVCENRPAAKAD